MIAKAEALKESDYTEASWKHFKTELSAAKAVLEAKESQEAVDEAAKTLQLEIDALVKATPDDKKDETEAVDTSSLEKLIASAKDLKKNDYTAATWTTLQNALANAEKAVEAKESQKSIDAAEKNLQAAIDGLKKASATIIRITQQTITRRTIQQPQQRRIIQQLPRNPLRQEIL